MTSKILFCILITLLEIVDIKAGNDNYHTGARSAGMANASVTLTDVWCVHHNQAGLAGLDKITGGIYYENRFLIPELGLKAAAVAIPVTLGSTETKGVFGISYSYFGFNLYNDSKVGVAYSKKFGEKFFAGIQIDYLSTRIGEIYGKTSNFAAEASLQAQLSDKLKIGMHIFNPTWSKKADYNNERIPTIMRLGMSYTFSDKVFVTAEVEKDIAYKPSFKTGIEYHAVKELFIRTGISTNPVVEAFGIGLLYTQLKIDISLSVHQVLGLTTHASIAYQFK